MAEEQEQDDTPLSIATFDQIAAELSRRSIGCVVGCLVRMTAEEEHVFANWYGRTVAIGLCERIQHRILNEPAPNVPDDSG
jgi:hypothetical protein